MGNNATEKSKTKAKGMMNKRILSIWIFACLTGLPILVVALGYLDFLFGMSDRASALFATILYVILFLIIEIAAIRLFTFAVRKERGFLYGKCFALILFCIAKLTRVLTLAFAFRTFFDQRSGPFI